MRRDEIEAAVDIHQLLDRLELISDTQEYYLLNHTTPQQRDELLQGLTATVELWLHGVGITT